jgi:predicted component of type VI protein secretion system
VAAFEQPEKSATIEERVHKVLDEYHVKTVVESNLEEFLSTVRGEAHLHE